MEQEYKWMADADLCERFMQMLSAHEACRTAQVVQMAAAYYETADGLLRRLGVALRLRRENDRSVCCMKRTLKKEGALAVREEYEVQAENVQEGLQKLPEAGAPHDLCIMLSAQQLMEFARTEFVRHCYLVDLGTFTAEFAVDAGALGNHGIMQPFEEIELELKTGDAAAFRAYAERVQTEYSLTPQPLSKLARAAAVKDCQ